MAPTLTKELKPTWAPCAQSRMDVQMAPLWLSRATWPGRAIDAAKLALRLLGGGITPRQLGPMTPILPPAISGTAAPRSPPAPPSSDEPAPVVCAPAPPRATHPRVA